MWTETFLGALLLVAACSGKRDEERVVPEPQVVAPAPPRALTAAGTPVPTPSPAPTPALEPSATAKPGKLTCAGIVSAAARAKFFAGHTLTDAPRLSDSEATCLIDADDPAFVFSIDANCSTGTEAAIASERENPFRHDGMKALAGVGAGAFIRRRESKTDVFAYDDDSECRIDVSVAEETDAVALVKQILADLPPKRGL